MSTKRKTDETDFENPEKKRQKIEKKECSICFNEILFGIKTECLHEFCFCCLKEYKDRQELNYESNNEDSDIDNEINESNIKCPLCRHKINIKLIENAKINFNEWINAIKKINNNNNKIIIIWVYCSKNNNNLWSYLPNECKYIENMYNKWKIELENENENEIEKNEIEICKIEIATKEYIINFDQMFQYNINNIKQRRDIKRIKTTYKQLLNMKNIVGCSGKYFDK